MHFKNDMTFPIYKNIEQIIPHRWPIIMMDNYQKIDNDSACSSLEFKPENYGCKNGWVMQIILIEAVAQTVAAHFGYKNLKEKHKDDVPGMLTNVDEFIWHEKIKDTSKIEIFVQKTDEIGPFKIISSEIRANGKCAAHGQIKIFNPGEKAAHQ